MDAIRAASSGHHFLSVTKQGLSAIVSTHGNDSCHVILRGGAKGPNYTREYVQEYVTKLDSAGVISNLMIDCSHGNSSKLHKNQIIVARDIASQLSDVTNATAGNIVGVMIESHLREGKQSIPKDGDLSKLEYGKSVTDACIHFEDTVEVLRVLAEAVRARRVNKYAKVEESNVMDEL